MTILEVIEYGRRQENKHQDTEFWIGRKTNSKVYCVPYDNDEDSIFMLHIPVQDLLANDWELKIRQEEGQTSLPLP